MTQHRAQIVLASQSPRRRALLEQIGVSFDVEVADIDESRHADESLERYVSRLAESKAAAVQARVAAGLPILGADTIVVLDDCPLGKPRSPHDAHTMLTRLSGRQHEVFTAVALITDHPVVVLSRTRVWFRPISAAERDAYIATGEPMDKAGGYAIQGRGAAFVERIHGSYSAVVGLPLFETARLLNEAGVRCGACR